MLIISQKIMEGQMEGQMDLEKQKKEIIDQALKITSENIREQIREIANNAIWEAIHNSNLDCEEDVYEELVDAMDGAVDAILYLGVPEAFSSGRTVALEVIRGDRRHANKLRELILRDATDHINSLGC